jgi:hypothetical protein
MPPAHPVSKKSTVDVNQQPEPGAERKGRMMRLYMRQSLCSIHGTNNRYGNR